MQDHRGGWRFEETWPAPDTNFVATPIDELNPTGAIMGATRAPITFTYGPFNESVFIAGMPTSHIDVTPYHRILAIFSSR